jgi:hypothetical protein
MRNSFAQSGCIRIGCLSICDCDRAQSGIMGSVLWNNIVVTSGWSILVVSAGHWNTCLWIHGADGMILSPYWILILLAWTCHKSGIPDGQFLSVGDLHAMNWAPIRLGNLHSRGFWTLRRLCKRGAELLTRQTGGTYKNETYPSDYLE